MCEIEFPKNIPHKVEDFGNANYKLLLICEGLLYAKLMRNNFIFFDKRYKCSCFNVKWKLKMPNLINFFI